MTTLTLMLSVHVSRYQCPLISMPSRYLTPAVAPISWYLCRVIRVTRRRAVWVRHRPSPTLVHLTFPSAPDHRTNRHQILSVFAARTSTHATCLCEMMTTVQWAASKAHWVMFRLSLSSLPTRAWKSAGWSLRLRASSEIPSRVTSHPAHWKTCWLSILACRCIIRDVVKLWWNRRRVLPNFHRREIGPCRCRPQWMRCHLGRWSHFLRILEKCLHRGRKSFHAAFRDWIISSTAFPLCIRRHGIVPVRGCAVTTLGASSTGKTALDQWLVMATVIAEVRGWRFFTVGWIIVDIVNDPTTFQVILLRADFLLLP